MKFNQPAPDGGRFSPDAFNTQIDKEVPVHLPGDVVRQGRILSAKVAEDGLSAELEIDLI